MITYSVENWDDVKEEASESWEYHWEEVGQNKAKMKLNPDLEKLDYLNSMGKLHCVIVRDDGILIGYHASVIDNLIHYKHVLAAKCDLHWLHPDYRHGFTGIRLFKEVERSLKARGVQVMYDFTKTYLDKGKVLEFLGYKLIEKVYSKWIGE